MRMSATALRGQDSVKPHSSVVNIISLLGAFYPGCITLADAKAEDNPLVYVNRGFTVATGYSWAEIRGRNCRFLHEGHNNQPALAVVRHALANRRDICIDVINVTKGGKQFINRLLLLHLLEDYVLGLQHIVPRQHFSLSGNGSTSLIEADKIVGQVKHHLHRRFAS